MAANASRPSQVFLNLGVNADPAKRMVFSTGGAFTSRAQELLDSVPNHRIDKPFDLRQVRELVRGHLVR